MFSKHIWPQNPFSPATSIISYGNCVTKCLTTRLAEHCVFSSSLLLADTVRPICLPFSDEELTPATPLWVIGWGFTEPGGGKSYAQDHRAEKAAIKGNGKEDHPSGKSHSGDPNTKVADNPQYSPGLGRRAKVRMWVCFQPPREDVWHTAAGVCPGHWQDSMQCRGCIPGGNYQGDAVCWHPGGWCGHLPGESSKGHEGILWIRM